jgi:hypothetical protein
LEEAINGAFVGVTNVHTTKDTCYGISDRGPTRYYYRVRYCSGSNCGGWSNVEWVDVVWEQEPNNPYAVANGPLVSGVQYRGYVDDTDDYFWIETKNRGQIQVHLRDFVVEGWLLLYYDKPHLPPAEAGCYLSRAATSCDVTYPGNDPPGRYYIRVFAENNNGSVPYTLWATFP